MGFLDFVSGAAERGAEIMADDRKAQLEVDKKTEMEKLLTPIIADRERTKLQIQQEMAEKVATKAIDAGKAVAQKRGQGFINSANDAYSDGNGLSPEENAAGRAAVADAQARGAYEQEPTIDDIATGAVQTGSMSVEKAKELQDRHQERQEAREQRAHDSDENRQIRRDTLEETRRYHDMLGGGKGNSASLRETAESRKQWSDVIKDTVISKVNDLDGKETKDMALTGAAHSLMRKAQSRNLDPYQMQPIVVNAVEQARQEAVEYAGKDSAKLAKFMAVVPQRAEVILSTKIGGGPVMFNNRFIGVAWDSDDQMKMYKEAEARSKGGAVVGDKVEVGLDPTSKLGSQPDPAAKKPSQAATGLIGRQSEASKPAKSVEPAPAEPDANQGAKDAVAKEVGNLQSQLNALRATDTSKMNQAGKLIIENKIRELELRIKSLTV